MNEFLELIMPYIPYAVIFFNAVTSCLTYRRTGKITKVNPQTKDEVIDEDLQNLIIYHENTAKKLREKIIKK